MEAHDAASEEIHAAERKVKELAGENETLRVTQSDRLRDIEDENRHLKLEVTIYVFLHIRQDYIHRCLHSPM
jgi:hypothetical protein